MNISAGPFVSTLLALATATADAQSPPSRPTEGPGLRPSQAMIQLDYQTVHVEGDQAIDLLGFHVHSRVAEGLDLGAGLYAPLLKGAYGGFTAFDIGVHAQRPLAGKLFATAGVSAGGGAGGRSVEKAKSLSGTGGFYKGYVGLGYDFGSFSLGVNVSRLKFSESPLGGTQADVFVEIPYAYLTGPFASHGQRLSPAEARQASEASGETMLMVILDNYWQRNPEGTYKGHFNIVDLQYAHFLAADTYWFADLGVGYKGLPLSNQVLGGIGQRVRLSPGISLYGQLGIGSGIYAPEVIDTASGLLVYPKLAAETALTRDLGLSASAGYLVAPKGTSRNRAFGLGLTYHIRAGEGPAPTGAAGLPTYQGYRIGIFQQVDPGVRYTGIDRGALQMLGIQADAIVSDHVYIAVQGSIAYSTYLDHPGYGELLAGIGVQSRTVPGNDWQVFGQLMAGTNVHGLAVKASGGVRYGLGDRLALHATAGHVEARSAAGHRFSAHSVGLGLDYRFSTPSW